jgi:hypothetical protein
MTVVSPPPNPLSLHNFPSNEGFLNLFKRLAFEPSPTRLLLGLFSFFEIHSSQALALEMFASAHSVHYLCQLELEGFHSSYRNVDRYIS